MAFTGSERLVGQLCTRVAKGDGLKLLEDAGAWSHGCMNAYHSLTVPSGCCCCPTLRFSITHNKAWIVQPLMSCSIRKLYKIVQSSLTVTGVL